MIKAFKTEIKPTEEQKDKINRTIGTCRFIYNFYIAHNKELYKSGKPFMTGKAFSVWLNNEYLPVHPDKAWIKSVSSKSVKKSMEDACTAYTRFFKGLSGFPKFKKKGKSDSKMYFVKNSQSDCLCERHRLKIPTLGWVWLKEKRLSASHKFRHHGQKWHGIGKSGTILRLRACRRARSSKRAAYR